MREIYDSNKENREEEDKEEDDLPPLPIIQRRLFVLPFTPKPPARVRLLIGLLLLSIPAPSSSLLRLQSLELILY